MPPKKNGLIGAIIIWSAVACATAQPPPAAVKPETSAPDETTGREAKEKAFIEKIATNVAFFFTLLASDDPNASISHSHIGKFLQTIYEKQTPEMQTVLNDIDIEVRFETKQKLGIAMGLLECIARCESGDRKSCEIKNDVLLRYKSRADEIQRAAVWFDHPEAAHRLIALFIFGQVLEYGVAEVALDGEVVHTHVVTHNVRENTHFEEHWDFVMQYYHNYWHIISVESLKVQRINTTSPRPSDSEIDI